MKSCYLFVWNCLHTNFLCFLCLPYFLYDLYDVFHKALQEGNLERLEDIIFYSNFLALSL